MEKKIDKLENEYCILYPDGTTEKKPCPEKTLFQKFREWINLNKDYIYQTWFNWFYFAALYRTAYLVRLFIKPPFLKYEYFSLSMAVFFNLVANIIFFKIRNRLLFFLIEIILVLCVYNYLSLRHGIYGFIEVKNFD